MTESKEHKSAKLKAAGKRGKTEALLKSGRRVDALNKKKATEVERSGSEKRFLKSISRLKETGRKDMQLVVPKKDVAKAKKVVRNRPVKVRGLK